MAAPSPPSAKAAGSTAAPDINAISVSKTIMTRVFFSRFCDLSRYEPYVIMMPMPSDKEKNTCDLAVDKTLKKSSRSGSRLNANINRSPSIAPGSVTLRTMIATIITASAGIATLEKRSMPFAMPPMTITQVSAINSTVYSTLSG